jgi:rhamnosyltransferase
MKILGVLTSFYPDIDELERNINSFLSEIDYLIIWENTPREESYINRLIRKLNSNKVEVRTSGKNEYLAMPFNICFNWAKEQGYTHVLTMDQDSCFSEGHFTNYLAFIEKFTENDIATFGPNSTSREQKTSESSEVDHIFISGAVYLLDTFFALNGFNEELVIDAIDTEYCFRAKEKKYKIIVFRDIKLEHNMGYRYKHWTGLTLVPYSAQRTYYFIRNSLWLWSKFPQYYTKVYRKSFIKYRIVYRTLKLIFEKDSFLKFVAILTALSHVKTNRLGRFDKFQKKVIT